MQSSTQLIEWFEKVGLPKPNIIRYPELKDNVEVDKVELGECNFILYEIYPKIGHWTILFYNHTDDIIEFFDSYGMMVDNQLEYTHHKTPELLDLMVNSDELDFEVNHLPFQNNKSANCGKICAMRYLFDCVGYSKELFDNVFYHNIDNIDNRDEVLALLYDVLGMR